MQSDLALSRIQDIINNTTPLSLQTCYKDTCDLIFSELIPSNPSKHKRCCHSWWNPRLNFLKQSLRLKQRAWLKQKDNTQLKLAYQSLQKTFDKAIKKATEDMNKFNCSINASMTPKASGEISNKHVYTLKEKQSPTKSSMLRVRCCLNLVLCYRFGKVTLILCTTKASFLFPV